jgi:hypothetical protein
LRPDLEGAHIAVDSSHRPGSRSCGLGQLVVVVDVGLVFEAADLAVAEAVVAEVRI